MFSRNNDVVQLFERIRLRNIVRKIITEGNDRYGRVRVFCIIKIFKDIIHVSHCEYDVYVLSLSLSLSHVYQIKYLEIKAARNMFTHTWLLISGFFKCANTHMYDKHC